MTGIEAVYLDGVFALNAALDALLLSAAGRLTGRRLRPQRLMLAAALGGLYACAVFLPGLGALGTPAGEGAAMLVLLFAAFGERLLRPGGALLALSCALGGALLLLDHLIGGLHYSGGVPGSVQDAQLLLLAGSGIWAAASLRPRRGTASSGRTVPVLLEVGGKKRLLTALVDSGNGLCDPVSGKGVLIVEWDALSPCLPRTLTKEACAHPASHLREAAERWPEGHLRLIPCKTVQSGGGFLLALTADRARVDGAEQEKVPVALSPVRLSDGSYQALIGI